LRGRIGKSSEKVGRRVGPAERLRHLSTARRVQGQQSIRAKKYLRIVAETPHPRIGIALDSPLFADFACRSFDLSCVFFDLYRVLSPR
jgi:hypothetical protein